MKIREQNTEGIRLSWTHGSWNWVWDLSLSKMPPAVWAGVWGATTCISAMQVAPSDRTFVHLDAGQRMSTCWESCAAAENSSCCCPPAAARALQLTTDGGGTPHARQQAAAAGQLPYGTGLCRCGQLGRSTGVWHISSIQHILQFKEFRGLLPGKRKRTRVNWADVSLLLSLKDPGKMLHFCTKRLFSWVC